MTKTEHEVISIKNRVPIKSIRIERDYSLGDGITRFYTNYPEDLQGRVRKIKKKKRVDFNLNNIDYSGAVQTYNRRSESNDGLCR